MKKFIFAVVATLLVSANIAIAEAGDQALNGLIIGGGSGALVGQAIGRNTEATIIGATVGGVLGVIVGNELDRNLSKVHYHYRPKAEVRHIHHPYPPRVTHHKITSRRAMHRICNETVIIMEGKYRDKRVVKRECRNAYRLR